jgi:hypothetical protein
MVNTWPPQRHPAMRWPRRDSPDAGSVLAPVSSHTTARARQPATSFKGQPEGGQGILETRRQALGR